MVSILLPILHTIMERSIVTPSVSFSPESGGSVKLSRVMDEMMTLGTIRLNP